MNLPEDIFIKICDDFHNEVNSVLIKINPQILNDTQYQDINFYGKILMISDVLLLSNKSIINHSQIITLLNILRKYKTILENYYHHNNIATGFLLFMPEFFDNNSVFGKSLINYCLFSLNTGTGYSSDYFYGIELIGFPNDCYLKLIASLENGQIEVRKQFDPLFETEINEGKKLSKTKRTRQEQNKIDIDFSKNDPDRKKRIVFEFENRFNEFAYKVKKNIDFLLNSFNLNIEECESIIRQFQTGNNPEFSPEIEKIYTALNGKYFNISFERFVSVFNSDYSGEKITWLKSGPELKYFIDCLNEKMNISNEINVWSGIRFEMFKPVKDLPSYLRKQTSKDDYDLLIRGNKSKHTIYKLFHK